MKVILAHNFYQNAGGEDQVFSLEQQLLTEKGHHVIPFTVHNKQINEMKAVPLAVRTVWSGEALKRLRNLMLAESPDVIRFHNTFPLLSPSVYYAAKEVPIVQTVHNFRLLCLNAMLLRDGSICEDCITNKNLLPGVVHACYRNNYSASAVSALMLSIHRTFKTWHRVVDRFIVLSSFQYQKIISSSNLPANKFVIKPNLLAVISVREG